MSFSFKTKVQQEVWQVIQDINNTWVNGNPEDLANFFHENMVIVSSDFQELGKGREACVQSYKDFASNAIIQDFKEMYSTIDVFGNTAIISYSFKIKYEMNGETFHDTGRDMFVFIRKEDKWLAVWRIVLPLSPKK